MDFDYERDTKQFYRSADVAETYHHAFTHAKGWKALRFKIVAYRERHVVEQFLTGIPHARILDIPAGTGKMASVFARFGSHVTACDVSEEMLAIAMQEYQRLSYNNVEFKVCDAACLHQTVRKSFDVAVCLRLLHRVSEPIQHKILAELRQCAPHAIISFGVASPYHTLRRFLRSVIWGGGTSPLCSEPLNVILHRLEQYFDIDSMVRIFPGGSQEIVFLLHCKSS